MDSELENQTVMQDKYKGSINREILQAIALMMLSFAANVPRYMDFEKKFRMVLEHDPEKVAVDIKYFQED